MSNRLESGKKVISELLSHGHEAYFVGGFVRDFLLGINSNDIDITTSASPDEVSLIFEKTKPTGIKYGTVTVFIDEIGFEVTTFRSDGLYINHRHPDEVTFSDSLVDDLTRRDFTINALAMDIHGEIIDNHHGLVDLKNKIIRAVGDPNRRFLEDALRILRAFRFVSKLDFSLEKETKKAIIKHRDLLLSLASERVIAEFEKMIVYSHPLSAFKLMMELGIDTLFPSLKEGIRYLVKTSQVLDTRIKFFAFCFYLNQGQVPEHFRFSNKDKQMMSQIINLMSVTQEDSFQQLHIYTLKSEVCYLANELNVILNPSNNQSALIQKLDQELPIRRTCDLAFKGGDILELTVLKDATVIGDIIDDLIFKVLNHQLENEYQTLKKYTFNTYFKE